MPEEYRNIYKSARRSAGLTQEAAAERLSISVESIRAYENGGRIPSNDIVERMVVCYNIQYLAVEHLHETNVLMARVVPPLERRSVMETVVRLYNRLKRFEERDNVERLMEMVEDGKIDASERSEFEDILDDIRELVRSGLELDVFCRSEGG